MSGGSPDRFRYHLTGAQTDQVRDYAAREIAAGRGAEVTAAYREIDYRLRFEADEWGESREYFAAMKLQVRFGTAGPVSVWYSVHAEVPEVFVREFRFRGDPSEG